MKNKNVAGFLALIFGFFGVHRFYLGQRAFGILYMIIAFFAILITAEEGVPFILAPAILALVDAVLFFAMPKEDFDRRYNKARNWYGRHYQNSDRFPAPSRRRRVHQSEFEIIKRRGIQNFRDYRFDEAAEDFEQALSLDPENAAIHYNLAATYSMLEDEQLGFQHLEDAVEYGFDQVEKIHNHDALAFLRSRPAFQSFVDNGYQMPLPGLEAPEEELELEPAPQQPDQSTPDSNSAQLLEQIVELGKLRDRGILTDAEFAQQKEKILLKQKG
ncbi:MAG: NINE protein [Phaeodactylibacter sp.]|uniref:NINE protein n=1 Tax=Phaeodactylibacter sp. TaxID=1940289 RepID=UPI0032EE2FFF